MNNDRKILKELLAVGTTESVPEKEQIKILLKYIRKLESKSISFDNYLYYKGLYEDYDLYMNY